jgi:putative ABC transport system permease protein
MKRACPPRIVAAVKASLMARHGREDFTITTQEDMLRTLSNILDILTMAVGALGSISLLVGGVGIVTIMTIAVSERTSEIGLAGGAGRTTANDAGAVSGRGGGTVCAGRGHGSAAGLWAGAIHSSGGAGAAGAHAL